MNKQVVLLIFEKLNYKHQNYIGDNEKGTSILTVQSIVYKLEPNYKIALAKSQFRKQILSHTYLLK